MKTSFLTLLSIPILPLGLIFTTISYRYVEGDDDIKGGTTYKYNICSDVIGPIYKGVQTDTYKCWINVTQKSNSYGYGFIELELFDSSTAYEYEYIEWTRTETQAITYGMNYFDFSLNFNNYNFQKQMYITVIFGKTNSDVLAKTKFTVIPLDKNITIDTANQKQALYSNHCFQLDSTSSFTEFYKFDQTVDYFSNDKYMKFDLSDIYIEYSSAYTFFANDIKLVIFDNKNLFKNIENITNDGYPFVNLNSTIENNKVYFEINENLYIDKDTLESYSTESSNTQLTKSLYIPRGSEQDIDQYECEIRITGIGINKININHKLTFYVGRTIIGDCISSDYCLVGGIRD